MRKSLSCLAAIGATFLAWAVPAQAVIIVTPTTNSTALATALGGTGMTINSATVVNGASGQFGIYTHFTTPPVTFADGVVLSSGLVAQTPGPSSPGNDPTTRTGQPSTAEFNAYGPGKIENFSDASDVAALEVKFTLPAATAIQFDFIFGSVEYPEYVNDFTDAFLVFLDGTDPADQITFDSAGNPVQVGASFTRRLTTADLNTAFGDPHALIRPLMTITPVLTAGVHTLRFEVGDVNDHFLDSAAFIANLRAGVGDPGTGPSTAVAEPSSLLLLSIGIIGLSLARRRNKFVCEPGVSVGGRP